MIALRRGRFREPGRRTRGPLGLGTDFESVRDYLPDDDVRQINWLATARTGRPMSNQYRVEQDRDVDLPARCRPAMSGADRRRSPASMPRSTRSPRSRSLPTKSATACGVVVFDDEIRRRLAPRRSGGRAVVQAILDVEPRLVDSDYDLAFRAVGGGKRGLVIVFTDLVDEAAARSLLAAVPGPRAAARGRRRVGHAIPTSTTR